jgi:uncharacterized protein YbjT (DUF2867 family)
MRLALFGATGRTGAAVVDAALAAGWSVQALVREGSTLAARPGLDVRRGELGRASDLEAVLRSADAACSVVGPRPPFEDLFCGPFTRLLAERLASGGPRRIVCVTGAMIGDLPANVSPPMRLMAELYRRQLPAVAEDRAAQEAALMASDLDWTLVKPPRLTDGPATGRRRAGPVLSIGLLSRLSRRDLASFLVGELAEPHFPRQRVYVRQR